MEPNTKHVATRAALVIVLLSIVTTAGCGVVQWVGDASVNAAKWVFTTKVKTMNVDLTGRMSLNVDDQGQSLSTVVRFYQLKDTKTFAQLSYAQLQSDDLDLLKADLLATKTVVLRPGASASLAEPMNADTQAVGVVAFVREPAQDGVWRLAIPKAQWKNTNPVKIEVNSNRLVLTDSSTAPVSNDSLQQVVPSTPASSTTIPQSGTHKQG
ncbi:type VI secretion system protein VasD [Paraburkholderia sacchari]|uniref:type VI secretion system lipoprotein TssJ n=1 Tax=Paraburkholderia sacchari TaxID=159450 RepID=UPI0039A6D745